MYGPEPERILLLDAARGLAIWGILICNAPAFGTGIPADPPAFVAILFQHRFLALFAMLFGASMVMIGGRRAAPKRDARLRRRLGWLAVFGIVHGALIWWGDILLAYAITGLLTMSARAWPARRLIAVGAGGFALLVTLSAIAPAALAAPAFAGNADHWWHEVRRDLPGNCLSLAPLMLLGMGLFKAGLFTGTAPAYRYRLLASAGLLALIAIAAAWPGSSILSWAAAPPVALGCVGLLALAARSRWSFVPRALASAGRMTLTNYLLQSVVMTAIATVHLRPVPLMIFAALFGAAQAVLSSIWLARFGRGPIETLWRRLYRQADRPSSLSGSPSWPRALLGPPSCRFHKDGRPT